MLDTLMKSGAYRVDYFNLNARGSASALGLYVCGSLDTTSGPSVSAKRHLYAGLLVVEELLEMHNLVGVYVDVDPAGCAGRQAFRSLRDDVLHGAFKQVLVMSPAEMLADPDLRLEWAELFNLVPGLEMLTYNEERAQLECVDLIDFSPRSQLVQSMVIW